MKNFFLKNIRSDDAGGSITYLGIFGILLVCLLGIWVTDITKNLSMTNQYQLAAQRATQTAAKDQNSLGGLNPSAINVVIKEYENQTQVGDKKAFADKCRKDGYPKISIFVDNTRNYRASYQGDGLTPIFTSQSYQTASETTLKELEMDFAKNNYQVIAVRVDDVVQDYFTPIFNDFGCKVVTTDASTILSSSRDEDDFIKMRKPN